VRLDTCESTRAAWASAGLAVAFALLAAPREEMLHYRAWSPLTIFLYLRSAGGRSVARRAVAAGRLRPARVDALVDHVDDTVVGLDVARVAGAGGRGLDGAEGVVDEVLAEHAAVGDRAALERGEVGAAEGAGRDHTLDDMVLAHLLGERTRHRGELLAGPVAWGEDGDVRLAKVDTV